MKFTISLVAIGGLVLVAIPCEVQARGFGAARAGVAVGPRGAAVGGAYGGVRTGPYGGFEAGGARGGTYVGPRGTTVQAGQVGGVSRGPLGGFQAGGAEAARVTTPGGRTYTTGSAAGIGAGPYGGVHAHAVGGTAIGGPYGGAAAGYRGGVAVGPYGGVSGGVRVGAAGAVGGVGVGVGHATHYVSPAAMRTQASYVRTGFYRPYFTTGWYRGHPGAWVAPNWRFTNFWVAPAWGSLSLYCGITAPPISYDYGSNVVIQNNTVYVNGEQTVSAEDYAAQAATVADVGRAAMPADDDVWQSLGVFGMIQGEEKMAQHIFQLAVNKASVIRGNYYNAIADTNSPVYGSVDPKTQRAAWSIGEKKDIVFEAGLNNLTQQQTPVLVHYGKDRTEQMVLVRLEQPKDDAP